MASPSAAYRGSEPYVFVSYAHANVEIVHAEIAWLQQQGVRVWYDKSGINAGTEWSDEIAGAIKAASVFVYFMTPESVASEHCRRELNFAQNNGCPVIAVHLEQTKVPDGLSLSLDNRQAILKQELEHSAYQDMLLSALAKVRTTEHHAADVAGSRDAARLSAPWSGRTLLTLSALALLAVAIWLWSQLGESVDSVDKSVAVLPFVDLSAAGDQQHFGDGMAEEIISALTELEGLQVTARTSSFAFRERQTDLRDIARVLQVSTILEGSIRRDGERLRITAQLINAADGFHLWSDTYERELDDLFAIQSEIAQSVAATLGVTLGVGDVNAFRGAGTQNIDAFEAYQRAATESRPDAIRTLKRAVQLDPEYAAAWAALGLNTAATMWDAMPEQAPAILDEAIPYLLKAVELEDESAYAYTLLAVVNYARLDWIRSEEFLRQALAISPDPEYTQHHANMLMRAGRTSAALQGYQAYAEATRNEQFVSPLSLNVLISLGRFELLRSLTSQWPEPMQIYLSYVIAINEQDSELLSRILPERIPFGVFDDDTREMLLRGLVEPDLGAAGIRAVFEDTNARWPSKYHDLMLLAAYFDDPELAVEIASREARLTTIRMGALWYPVLSKVRQLPAFKELLTEVNLPEYWHAYGWSDHCWPTGEQTFECG